MRSLYVYLGLCLLSITSLYSPISQATPSSVSDEQALPTNIAIQILTHSLDKQQQRPPAPLPHIHTEGTLPHQGIYDESITAKQDIKYMYHAALLWTVTHDKQWLTFASNYLMTWIHTYQPSLNPIDETGFDDMINTYVLIKHQLSPEEEQQASDYFSGWAQAYIDDIHHHTNHKNTWTNNWQSHRVKLVTLIAVALHNKSLLAQARDLFQQQISQNINADGETIDFKQRHAIHYVVYDLEPLVQAALAAKTVGEDWYHWTSDQHASLATAIDWLTPYATSQIPHEEFVGSTVKFDIIRQQAHIHGFSGPFNPKDAGTLYWHLTLLNKQFLSVANTLMPTPPVFILDPHLSSY